MTTHGLLGRRVWWFDDGVVATGFIRALAYDPTAQRFQALIELGEVDATTPGLGGTGGGRLVERAAVWLSTIPLHVTATTQESGS